jgi:superfamily II DNA or RNA helicase
MLSPMDSLALLISPLGFWNLFTLRLRHVHEEGEEFAGGDFIDKTTGIDDKELKRLVELCLWTQSDNLFAKSGRNFSNKKAFFEKADKTTQRYVSSQVDQRITEAVAIAARIGVHVFFAPKPGEWLKQQNELHFDAEPLKLHAAFTKTDDGIDYRLTLGDAIIPSKHRAQVLCNNPSLFVIDHSLRQLDEGLGGKLLTPFLKKEIYHIPVSIQAKYFRQFILKIVKKIDISSEGFDVDNLHPQGKAVLTLQASINGSYSLETQFVYDTATFTAANRREKSVTLHDDGASVTFVCIWRNREWEAAVTELLDNRLHRPQTASLQKMTAWLTANEAVLAQHGIETLQRTTHHYVIGEVKRLHDDRWTGDWFQMHVTLVFPDGTRMALTDFRDAIINGDQEVRLPSGNWFVIPDEWYAQYSAAMLFGMMKSRGTLTFHRSQQTVLPTDDLVIATPKTPETATEEEKPLPPHGLKATLRPYQLEGYQWMLSHQRGGSGCLLGDDMGLGKTVQTIAVILHYFESTASTLTATQKDDRAHENLTDNGLSTKTADFDPQADYNIIRSNNIIRSKSTIVQTSLFSDEEMSGHAPKAMPSAASAQPDLRQKAGHRPVLVAAPSSVVFNWHDELRRFAPTLRVVEYTGNARERAAKQSLLAGADVVLTSYPMLRNDIGVLSRLSFAIAVYDEAHAFRNNTSMLYQAVLKIHADFPIALTGTPMVNALDELWTLMSVLNPALLGDYETFQNHFIHPINVNLQDEHTAILRKLVAPYFLRRLRRDVLDSLPERQDEQVWCDMTEAQAALYEEEQSKMRNLLMDAEQANNRIVVLAAITRLRRLACSPWLEQKEGDSGKVQEVFDRLEELRDTDHKVLLFSEFTSFLDVIAKEMENRGWTYDLLTGQSRDRETIVKHFQQTPSCQFFLVSLKAGGEGLNLTEADYVFLLDPWWNHAAEEQAIARAHRSGQRRSVMVYRFITRGSLEEQIQKVQDRKDDLVKAIIHNV